MGVGVESSKNVLSELFWNRKALSQMASLINNNWLNTVQLNTPGSRNNTQRIFI